MGRPSEGTLTDATYALRLPTPEKISDREAITVGCLGKRSGALRHVRPWGRPAGDAGVADEPAHSKCLKELERAKGIDPSYEAWEASVLPLNYARDAALAARAS